MNPAIRQRIADIRRGNVPAGYKRTKLGIIPSDWNLRIMGELTSHLTGQNGSSTGLPAYSINNQIGFIPQNLQFEDGSYDYLDKTSYRVVARGQFAYNPARINVGSIGVLKDRERVIVSSLYVCFSVGQDVDSSFLEYWFNTPNFHREIIRNTEGSVREYLFYENFANIRIALSPLAEQRRIAGILGCCDRGIALKKELIAEKKRQKKALMQKLLNPDSGFRLPGFAGDWVRKTIGNVAPLQRGFDLPNAQLKRGKYPVVYSNGILSFHNEFMVEGPGVVTGRSGTIGAVFYVAKNFWPHNTSLWVTDFCGNIPLFVYYLFQFINFSKCSSGSGVPTLNRNDIHKLIVNIPTDKNEQQAIADILSAADREIDLLEQELAQQQQKKKSLMQLLLTGIARV